MGRRWQMLLGLGAGLLVAGYSVASLTGCSNAAPTSSRPAASQLKEGLNVLDASDPSVGLSAAYLKSGRVVYIETRVGLLKPEVYRNEGRGEPDNEMDLRFVDQNNFTFFVQRGGDNFADPTWAQDVLRSEGPVATKADRTLDWTMAIEAATALARAVPATFKDHVYHLTNFAAQPNPATDPALLQKLAAFEAAAPKPAVGTQGYSGTYSSNVWTQTYVAKWSRGLLYVASHSATQMFANPDVGTWLMEISACNHGTCYNGGDGMSDDCYSWNGGAWWGSATTGTSFTGAATGSIDGANDGMGGCQTAYAWYSGSGSHECNDDAAYELYQGKHGPTNQAGWGITNQSSHCDGDFPACGASPSNFACNCAGSACSGDWNTPNCGGNNL
ncbi:MAG TPA: hypothetical protein VGL81_07445 [Polyangiaceae bacterium]|jgi:hypothetical protein